MASLFNTVLYEPIFNFLLWLYQTIPGHDLGIAIIIVTVLIRLILYFPSLAGLKSQIAMAAIQPKLDELRKRLANNREELGREMMKLYKEHKVSPVSSCLPMLIQLPVLIALYQVFFGGLSTDPATGILVAGQLDHLYPSLRSAFEAQPISTLSFGFINMAATKNIVLALLAAGLQFWQSKMIYRRQPKATSGLTGSLGRQMVYLFPIMTFFFGYTFPAGLALYWVVTTAFTIGQQWLFYRKAPTT